jgi:acyl-CoA hydrolase
MKRAMPRIDADSFDLASLIRPGDAIVWGQACGEPTTLIEMLLAQRQLLGGVSAFAGSSFSGILKPEHTDHIAISSMGGIGALRSLAKSGVLGIIPCHVGQIGSYLAQKILPCDVAFIQVSPADAAGYHSYGLINDYTRAAVKAARIVIAEINNRIPRTLCDVPLHQSAISHFVETDRAPVTVASGRIDETDIAIAKHAADFIGDGAILQFGIGAVPDAIARLLSDRRNLGLHSGMVGDALVDLTESGALTNATKAEYRGISITGALIGSQRLYDFANANPAIKLCASSITHNEAILSALPKLVSINSAIEVDLTGQVNAEAIGGNYLGATGGQVDYVRGASRAPGGRSIIALPAQAPNGGSRIVAALSGPVTTSRSEVDIVVTEFGAAELKGQTLANRARRMIEIAHPDCRAALDQQAHSLLQRGF